MTSMIDYSADIQISECMNDIINRVETREWNRVNEHRDRLVKKMKKQNEKIQYWKNATGEAEDNLDEQMKENEEMHEALQTDWVVATEKIGQENSDLHNEIKRLKNEMKDMKQNLDYWMKGAFSKDTLKIKNQKLQEENEQLKFEVKRAENAYDEVFEKNEELSDENEKLQKERDDYLENWKSTTRKYVAITTRKQRLKQVTDK